jgi:predicted SprT family Zn-dependent metalloprotease
MDLVKLRLQAEAEMAHHGLVGWTFEYSRAKRRLGCCKYSQRLIEISAYYAVHTVDELVIDTLRHEIAHALAGPDAGHGPLWKAHAIRLGARPKSCKSSDEVKVRPGDWQVTCPACQQTYHKYKKPKVLSGYRCKCPAKSPLTFAFAGDPKRLAPEQKPLPTGPHWQARCASCEFIHSRYKPPSPGKWTCRCPLRGELEWQFVKGDATDACMPKE